MRRLALGLLVLSLQATTWALDVVHLGRNHSGSLVTNSPTSFTLIGGGNDAWDNMDECTFASVPVTGDFDVSVRIHSLSPNSRYSKAGLMVRENLSESARMVFNRVTPPAVPCADGDVGANDSRLAYRTGLDETAIGGGINGGRHEDGSGAPGFPNAWLRLERIGSVLSAYRSSDGTNWTLQGTQNTATWAAGELPPTVLVGMAVSRGPGGNLTARAEFRDYRIRIGTNQPVFRILSASSEGNPNGVKVVFNRPVRDDATNLGHWAISPGTISNATFGASPNIIHFTTSPLVEGQTYTLGINGVADRVTGEEIPAGSVFPFVHGAGYEARRIAIQRFDYLPGPSTELVLSSSAYARDLPDAVYSSTLFEDTTPDAQDDFSGRIFGVLNITNTGDYRFFACSDDQSRLYLSSDDRPGNKIEIAREPEWNNARQYATADRRGTNRANVSAPIRLEAGRRYFLEQVFAEGYQGNNASVAWQPPGAPEPVNGSLPIDETAFAAARYFKGTIFYSLGRPVFLTQPRHQTVTNGQTASFSVRMDGTPPYSYQWQKRSGGLLFVDIPGATSAAYARLVTTADDGTQFRCIVRNDFSGATSLVARLTVPACLLGIDQQPADVTVFSGQSVSFSVGATGTPAVATYQWQAGPGSEPFTNIPPATSSTLTLIASMMDNGTRFRCLVGNGCTTITSSVAMLAVRSCSPTLVRQPTDVRANAGDTVSFTVEAWALEGPFTYQWQSSSGSAFANIAGATSATYTKTATLSDNGAQFRCIVASGCSNTISAAATLRVDAPVASGTVLIFEPANDLAAVPDTYGDRVTSAIDAFGNRYAPGSGGTSNVTVEYGPPGSFVRMAAGPYGALANLACQEDGDFGVLEIQLTADTGYQVALRGFDLAAETDDVILPRVEVLGDSGVPLHTREEVFVPGFGGTCTQFDFSAAPLTAGSILIRIGLSSLANEDSHLVGIDNISFSQSAGTGCPPPPRLTITKSGGNIVLSWAGAGYRLERSSTVGSKPGWISVPGTSPVTWPIATTGAQFFRLVCP